MTFGEGSTYGVTLDPRWTHGTFTDRKDPDTTWMLPFIGWTTEVVWTDGPGASKGANGVRVVPLLWGLHYTRGLTEAQDSDHPWRDAATPLPLVRLYRTEEVAVRYTTEPPVDPDVPAVLVDRVYDLLFAALAEHDLISCPTTETGPANGVESGHVHDIAERIVRSLRTAGVTA